jgi:hypothetical protein
MFNVMRLVLHPMVLALMRGITASPCAEAGSSRDFDRQWKRRRLL